MSQVVLTTLLTSHPTPSFSSSLFESVNVRHAGFDCIDLNNLSSGVLVMFIAMMYLAPMPYISALKTTMLKINKKSNEEDMMESRLGLSNCSGTSFNGSQDLESGHKTPVGASFPVTKNSRKLCLTLSKDNKNAMSQNNLVVGGGSHSEKAIRRSGISTFSRKSIIRKSKSRLGESSKIDERNELDTRLLILTEFEEGEKVPLSVKVGWRLRAVRHQMTILLHYFYDRIKAKPGIVFLFFTWFLVCCIEGFQDQTPAVFNALFEIVSCFGNVGLSLGTTKGTAGVAFSHDLSAESMLLLIVVMVAGRVREIPSKVDAVLTITHPVNVDKVLTEAWLNKSVFDGEDEDDDDETDDDVYTPTTGMNARQIERGLSGDGGARGSEEDFTEPLLRDFNGTQGTPIIANLINHKKIIGRTSSSNLKVSIIEPEMNNNNKTRRE